jgi:hypothetical protein
VPFIPQSTYHISETGITVKIAREEKGSFCSVRAERFANHTASLRKFMSREYQIDLALRGVHPGNCAFGENTVILRGGGGENHWQA